MMWFFCAVQPRPCAWKRSARDRNSGWPAALRTTRWFTTGVQAPYWKPPLKPVDSRGPRAGFEAYEKENGRQNASRTVMPRTQPFGLKIRWWMAACILMGIVGSPLLAQPEGYRIGAGDVIQIVVWREPDASLPDTVVRSDGKISVPLIGEVSVAGLTPEQIQGILVDKFSRYINNPVVSVHPRQINSRKVYVMGKVKKEGPIMLTGPMTVLQALDEAGGLAEWANKSKIYILRKDNGKQVKLSFDYKAVIKGQQLEQNITLLPDDTIVVP
jgi:polysaccharide export outer membrane protein